MVADLAAECREDERDHGLLQLTNHTAPANIPPGRYYPPLAPRPGTVNVSSQFQASFARTNGSATQAPDAFPFVDAKVDPMRDFRDAKAMAQTLREALAAKSIPLTHSDSLELIARLFGQRDWNTLAARIQAAPPSMSAQAADPAGESPPISARQEIAVDPATFDNYSGFYQLNDRAVFTVTPDGHHLVMQLTGQRSVRFFAESATEFFAKIVDAQVSFVVGPDGRASSLVLHQNGNDIAMARIDAATATKMADQTAERVKNQSASPGTEAALHRLIDGIASGNPDYTEMSPALAAATRKQMQWLQPLADLGNIQSIRFLGVGEQGEDVYSVKHANGAAHWRIALDAKGIISTAWVTPGP
ncbi:glyoxalase superfamily protein [Bradyrhizobium sp. USDA 4451]